MIDAFRIGAQGGRSARALLRDLHPQEVAVKRGHLVQIANANADVAKT
jgi:hypothetical protein